MTTKILQIGGLATLLSLTALPAANAQNSVGNAIGGTAGGQGATGGATAPSLRGTDLGNPRETIGSTGELAQPARGDENLVPGENPDVNGRAGANGRRAPGAGGITGPRRGMMGANAGSYAEQAVIGHAVAMAIEASGMKACAELAGAKEIDQAQAENNRDGGARMDPAEQLMLHARQGFQDSQVLLGAAGGDVIGRDQLRPATDKNPRDKRIYQAAGSYIVTLVTLSGMDYGRPGADPDRVDASQKVMAMSPQDKATVALINHSVKQAIDGTHILQSSAQMPAGGSRATEALLRHGREMRDNGTQTLMRLVGNQAPAETKAGEATVMLLAQRGRDLVEAYAVGAPRGGEMMRDGAARRNRDGAGAPAADELPTRDKNAFDTAPDALRPERNPKEESPEGRRPAADKPESGSILNGTAPATKDAPR